VAFCVGHREGFLTKSFTEIYWGAVSLGHRDKEIYKSSIGKVKICGTI
jgi:hypothetical protein